ncbi:hypothetical protein EYR41_006570 [Orbilia oligospora]|uniref:Peptidase C14 caspase domain-containing protein n=1 Tax=Orbilia oligospora TaxID=2813651 RepID=A0A7C8TRS1_ORBOL|nr:hypothetical protein TWF751_001865 [Orbilia oligospora]TGJ67436.1 hypothetical protein EYR41_006570 [Orbilia oligospora]
MGLTKWAILIGIDYYQSGAERPGVEFHNLKGSVEDIRQIEGLLCTRFDFNDSYITRLTATAPDNGQGEPKESISSRPTYENIIQAFQKVIREANPHDIVYVHYSGHGARVDTVFPDIKGNRLDEVLVPTDISCGGRYVRDVEIAYLINKMVDKKLIVTVVLDCCHSGGANRGGAPSRSSGGSVVRGIDRVDKNILNRDFSLLSPQNELNAAGKGLIPNDKRAARVENHWLLEPRGYAFLAACKTNEYAMEDVFDEKSQGLLTHTMINVIKASTASLTYYGLCNLVRAKVLEHNSQQTVVLGGEADRIFLSSDRRKLHYMVPIKRVTEERGKLHIHLDVGSTHGIPQGASIDVWRPSCSSSNFKLSEKSAVFRTVEIDEFRLVAELEEWGADGEQKIHPGFLARPNTASKRLVYLDPAYNIQLDQARSQARRPGGEAQNSTSPLAEIRRVLKAHDIPVSNNPEDAFFQVHVKDGSLTTLCGNKNLPNQITLPPLSIYDEGAAEKLACCITDATKYYDILELSNPEIGPFDRWISASIAKELFFTSAPRLSKNQPDCLPESKSCEVVAADKVVLRVTNISDTEKYVTILDLDLSGCVMQIFPSAPGATQQILEPNETLSLPLIVESEENAAAGQIIDTIKIIATTEPTSFRWLEVPSIDRIASGNSSQGRGVDKRPENICEFFSMQAAPKSIKSRSVSACNFDLPWWDATQVTLRSSKGEPKWDSEYDKEEAVPGEASVDTQLPTPPGSDPGGASVGAQLSTPPDSDPGDGNESSSLKRYTSEDGSNLARKNGAPTIINGPHWHQFWTMLPWGLLCIVLFWLTFGQRWYQSYANKISGNTSNMVSFLVALCDF